MNLHELTSDICAALEDIAYRGDDDTNNHPTSSPSVSFSNSTPRKSNSTSDKHTLAAPTEDDNAPAVAAVAAAAIAAAPADAVAAAAAAAAPVAASTAATAASSAGYPPFDLNHIILSARKP